MAHNTAGLRGGAAALLGGQWGKYLLQLLSFVVLARLLSPADFGLLAMVTSILGLATVLGDMGLSMAALQRATLSQGEKSNLFWLNTGTGLAAGAIAAGIAPLLGAFYSEPLLIYIGLAIAPTFAFAGMSVQFKVELNRNHRYKTLASIDFFSQLVAFGLAVGLALAGAGVWALVAQSVAASLIGAIWAVVSAGWVPTRWSRVDEVKPFLSFGLNTLALQALNYLASNLANVVAGRAFSAAAVGIYGRALQLVSMPVQQLASPLTRIALPLLAEKARQSDEALTLAATTVQKLLVTILVGALSFLVAVADPLIPMILGDDWGPAIPLVRVLAIGAAFQCVGYLYYWLFLAKARTGLLLRAELPGRVLLIVLLLAVWPLGLEALAWSFVASQAVIWATGTIIYVPKLRVAVTPIIRAGAAMFVMYTVASIAALAAGSLVSFPNDPTLLLGSTFAWLATVGIATVAIPACRRTIGAVARLLRTRKVISD